MKVRVIFIVLLSKPWLRLESIGTVPDVVANEGQFIKVARVLFQ